MKKKICLMLITVLILGLVGCGGKATTETVSTQDKKQYKEQIEEAIKNDDFDKAKTLAYNSNYHDLYTALDTYLRVANDVQMEWVHVVLDNDEESEFKEELNQLDEIPKVYKKYPELKSRVNIYKDELEKAVDLETEFRKGFKKLDKLYKEKKPDEYTKIGREWEEKADKEFPVTSESDDYREHLEFVINDIFKNKLAIYINKKGYDPSKMEDFESPYEKVQKENQDGDYDEVFTPESGESSDSSTDDIWISPDDVSIE